MDYRDIKNTKPPLATPKKTLDKKVARYDVHGAVAHVLRKIDQHVPRVFPHMPDSFVLSLKHLVKRHAAQNAWEVVSLSLSQGLAREELKELLVHELPHRGPIVVDATGSTPEHQTFESVKLVKVNAERIIMVNESMNDVLIVMYGLDAVDTEMARHLLLRRLRMTGNTLEMLREDFEWLDDQNDNPDRIHLKFDRAMKMVRDNLEKLLFYLSAVEKREHFTAEPAMQAQAEAFMMMVHLREALEGTTDPQLRLTLETISMQIRHIPENFRELNFSYGMYEKMAHDLMQERLEAKPVIAPPPPPRLNYNDFAPRPS